MKKSICSCFVMSMIAGAFADTAIETPAGTLHDVWNNGLPSATNPGRIDIEGSWLVNGSTDVTGWEVTQAAGTLTRAGNAIVLKNCKWQLDGGAIVVTDNSNNKAHVRVGDSKTPGDLVMTGGKISAEGCFDVALQSTFKQTGGVIEAKGGSRLSKGGLCRIEGGEAMLGPIHFSSPKTLLDFAGGSWTVSGDVIISKATVDSPIIRFSQGDGKLSIGNLVVEGPGYIDFSPGTKGELTVDGFRSREFERLWKAGTLRVNGENNGEFSEWFTVTENTLRLK